MGGSRSDGGDPAFWARVTGIHSAATLRASPSLAQTCVFRLVDAGLLLGHRVPNPLALVHPAHFFINSGFARYRWPKLCGGIEENLPRLARTRACIHRYQDATTPSYEGDLIGDSAPAEGGEWTAELFPRDPGDSPPRPIKLIDGGSGRAIADLPVRLEFNTKEGSPDSVTTTTNALGYVLVPFRVVLTAPEQTWVMVPGYRKTRLDFAWARRKTKLDRW
jgi:hypothetical protein